MPVYRLGTDSPEIHPEAWVHPDAVVIGRVGVGAGSSIWPGTVLRGDLGWISVGERTSIQDNCVLHAGPQAPTSVGSDCVVGHAVYLEGATIEDRVLVGSKSVVLGVTVRTGGGVAAGAVALSGLEVPAGFRAQGVPAELAPHNWGPERVLHGARTYAELADRYQEELFELPTTRRKCPHV